MASFSDWLNDIIGNTDIDKKYKCGEVFFRPCNKALHFLCTHCDVDFKDLDTFITHLHEELERKKEEVCSALDEEYENTLEPDQTMYIKESDDEECKQREAEGNTEDIVSDEEDYKEDAVDFVDFEELSYENVLIEIEEDIGGNLSDIEEAEVMHSPAQQANNDNPKKNPKLVYKCYDCNKVFSSFKERNDHQHQTHAKERIYSCDLCPTKFTRKSNLSVHRRRHLLNKSYVCDFCPFSFKSAIELKVHKRRHTGERPYVCEECGRNYTTSGQLVQHRQRRHLEERNYVCDTCSKAFVANHQLKRHIFLVHGNAPRDKKCNVCDATFKTVKSLTAHKYIHKGKTYVCVVCDRAFAQRPGLTSHMKTHNILPQNNDLLGE